MTREYCSDYGGRNTDGEPCGAWAGAGIEGTETGKCKWHRGTNADGSSHDGNQNARKHGAFSDHFRSDLTDAEIESLDALMTHLDGIDDERTLAAEIAGEALLKYKRSADSRFLREARQWMDNFNLLPNEDKIEASGPDGSPIMVLERGDGD